MLVAPPPLHRLQAKHCANGPDCDAKLLVDGPDCGVTDHRLDTEVTDKMSAISLHPHGGGGGSNSIRIDAATVTDNNVALLSNSVNMLEIKDHESYFIQTNFSLAFV